MDATLQLLLTELNEIGEFEIMNIFKRSSNSLKLYRTIINMTLDLKNYQEIVNKLTKESDIDLPDTMWLKIVKLIQTMRQEYIEQMISNKLFTSYLKMGTYHELVETKESTKDSSITYKQVQPNLIILQDLLSKYGIKINKKEVKSNEQLVPYLEEWISEIKKTSK